MNEILEYIYSHSYFSQDLAIALDYYEELKNLEDIVYGRPITLEDYLDYVKMNRKTITFDF